MIHNILIVDDDERNLRLLSGLLTSSGYGVLKASNGRVALRIAETKAPALILLDIMMSEMDGYEVCLRLKKERKTRDIPVIFLSAQYEMADKVKGFELGAVDYITKPFQIEEVLVRVKTHLTIRQLQTELEETNKKLKERVADRTNELRESEEKYRNIFNNAQVGMWRTRISDGKMLECNDRFAHIFGYENREDCVSNFVTSEHYIDSDSRGKWLSKIKESGFINNSEGQILRKDGAVAWVQYSSKINHEKGFLEGVATDIIERKEFEEELKRSREQLQNLIEHAENVREEERRRIARDIHDELGQILTVFSFDLSWIAKRLNIGQKEILEKVEKTSELIDGAIESVQKIASELRPTVLDDLGLIAGMEWQAREFEERAGIKCGLSIESEEMAPDDNLSTEIFRIFQEALTNVARHSGATEVAVSLEQESRELSLVIRDNGRGISEEEVTDSNSIGLIGIRERVRHWDGKVEIKGEKGKGTTVSVKVPMR